MPNGWKLYSRQCMEYHSYARICLDLSPVHKTCTSETQGTFGTATYVCDGPTIPLKGMMNYRTYTLEHQP